MLYLAYTLYYVRMVAVNAMTCLAIAFCCGTFFAAVWCMCTMAQFLELMITTLFVNKIHVILLAVFLLHY